MECDVLLIFIGEDIRRTFLSHLLRSLDRKSIRSVTSESSGSLENQAVVRESLLVISVISKNWTSSDYWVEGLATMLSLSYNKKVVPIFFRVDPVDVLKVLKTTEDSTSRTITSRLRMKEVEKWLERHLTRKTGFNSSDWEDDSQLVDKITSFISDEVKKHSTSSHVDPSLDWARNPELWYTSTSMEDRKTPSRNKSYVTIKSSWWDRVGRRIPLVHRGRPSETIKSSTYEDSSYHLLGIKRQAGEGLSILLGDSTKEVVTMGIYGMPGVGKTTLARYVYDELSHQFQHHFFINNFSNKFKREGSSYRPSLLRILAGEFLKTATSFPGRSSDVIEEMVGQRKVLFVADNVDDDTEQLKVLVKEVGLFGSGSRVIVVTQDRPLLVQCGVNHIFEVRCPRYEEAIQIFSHFAFKQRDPRHGFDLMSLRAVVVAGRIPLALEVLGSFLCNKDIDEWESTLDRLEASHDNNTAEFHRYIDARVHQDVPSNWSLEQMRRLISRYAFFNGRGFGSTFISLVY